jgi:cytoskeleton-associated protein 5
MLLNSEAYVLVGEKVWSFVGPLPPKEKTQLEERLRRVSGPSTHEKSQAIATPPAVSRLAGTIAPPGTISRVSGPPRAASPSVAAISRLARPASPAHTVRSSSPSSPTLSRSDSPVRFSRVPGNSQLAILSSPQGMNQPKSMLPSRLGRLRSPPSSAPTREDLAINVPLIPTYGDEAELAEPMRPQNLDDDSATRPEIPEDITITISSILSSDSSRSVDALKKIQKVLSVKESSPQYNELAEHTEGLIETITLQMAHIFERPDDLVPDENFRLAKHLIQTLNNFCDHGLLAESLTVDILTSLLEELTLRLLETDDSPVKKVKDLSRFINMIILRLFATGRRMSIFR